VPTASILHLFMAGPSVGGSGIRVCGFAFLVTILHGTIDRPFDNQPLGECVYYVSHVEGETFIDHILGEDVYLVNTIKGKAFILGNCD